MRANPLTENSRRNFEARRHVCFGISPFNSYFSDQRIEELAEWGMREFDSVHFFVPDAPAAFTLEALGHTPEKAASKARKQGQYTFNKICRALRNLGLLDSQAWGMILNWDRLSENPKYLELYAQAKNLFEQDQTFRSECLQASHWVLEKRTECVITPEVLMSAARYFLAEIPLFANTAGIVGAEHSVFGYHQSIPFLEKLYAGQLAYRVAPEQGYLVLEPASLFQVEIAASQVRTSGAEPVLSV
jgi:cyclo(L-tyrosyl-L-tyrosyl) synthase